MQLKPSTLLAYSALVCSAALGVIACGGEEANNPPAGSGGSTATGAGGASTAGAGGSITGGASAGGATNSSGGATASTGGKSTTAAGGTTSVQSGGASSKGGASASGGSTAVGGTSGIGGSAAGAGGMSASGGTSSTGGANSGGSAGSAGSGGGTGACASVKSIASSTCTVGESNCFSFFVASRARMFALAQAFNGSTKGWGGDFRYGQADGLSGADKICTEIAEQSLPGNCRKWRAFLSTSKVNAISRVGAGPWYDRLNRTIANDLTELVKTRPGGITVSTILNNLPNEDGTPHHNEETGCSNLNNCADNHDVLTGSDSDGKFCTSTTCAGGGGPRPGGGSTTVTDYSCEDWTLGTSKAGIAPRCGHTWPTGGGGSGDDWISHLTENGCAPGFNLVQNGGPNPTGNGSVGDGGGYGAIYCLALSE